MKKTAILAFVAAMPAMAGTPAPVVTVPVPAPAPVVAPAVSCCSLELAAAYNFAARDLYSFGKSVDTYGADLTAVYSFTPNHAVTLRMGYTYGSEVLRIVEDDYSVAGRSQVETFSIMPGYRFTAPISDKVSVFAGVNVGAACICIYDRETDVDDWGIETEGDKECGWGFAASLDLGLSFKVSETISAFVAYQLSGNTAKTKTFGGDGNHKQIYNGVRAGFGINF